MISLSSVPSSRSRLIPLERLMLFNSMTQDKFTVRSSACPFPTAMSICRVQLESCKFRSCSRSSPLSSSVLSGLSPSFEAQNSSRTSTRGLQRSGKRSWPRYIRIAATRASASGAASASLKLFIRSFNMLQQMRNSSLLGQHGKRCASSPEVAFSSRSSIGIPELDAYPSVTCPGLGDGPTVEEGGIGETPAPKPGDGVSEGVEQYEGEERRFSAGPAGESSGWSCRKPSEAALRLAAAAGVATPPAAPAWEACACAAAAPEGSD
mmetsp:Transcript_29017/g.72888  ORF Transcript_29017/g.72888 Transcript_29017/m.72888 type:complete len:265 (-) Transcript_29017:11-805(-)